MSEYRLKKTKEKVKVGDTIRSTMEQKFSFGSYYAEVVDTLTESNLKTYIELGIIEEISEEKKESKSAVPTDLAYYLSKIAKKLNISDTELANRLDKLNNKGFTLQVFTILLQEVADTIIWKQYVEPKIYMPKTRYVIDLENGNIRSNYNINSKLPFFCTIADAELAKHILSTQYNLVYGKQEGNKC